jgi:uncharacterized protein GlcG (DUF336 family)
MMRRRVLLSNVIIVVLSVFWVGSAAAQALIGEQRTVLSTGARELVDACLEYASANDLSVGVAVVDAYGNLLDYHTMEGTSVIAGESAVLKAKTAVRWRRSTEEMNQRVRDWENVAPVWIGDFPQRGGVPIFMDGTIVGAMGIGGAGGDVCALSAIETVLGTSASTTAP